MDATLDDLWKKVIADATADTRSIHGTDHWARVERNGVYLAHETGGSEVIVRLFALLHDCQRLNDGADPEHGMRAAKYAHTLRDALPMLRPEHFDRLCFACEFHTSATHTDDITVGVCWDADRLDLGRVGIEPSAKYMNSQTAKTIVRLQNWRKLDALSLRTF
jgi:uncharacterized protein